MPTGKLQALIIADDLTGALDTASPFAQRGWKVRAFTTPDAVPHNGLECDVLAVTTNSRHCQPAEARTRATSAARLADRLKPKLVLKKIDSRLKGNIEIECRAIASELGQQIMCVIPAAPDVGRFVVNGQVVGAGVETPISVREKFQDLRDVQIPDVLTVEDLTLLADQILQSEKVLAVCSRGLAVAIASRLIDGSSEHFVPALPILVAIGSRDPVTLAQVTQFQSSCDCQTLDALHGDLAGSELRTNCLLVKTSGDGLPSVIVANRFAASIRRLLEKMCPQTILLSGGDTAAAVLDAFDCSEIEVCGEAAAGLPWCRVALNGNFVQLISKSGGFGTEDTLVQILGRTVQPFGQEIEHSG